MARFDLYTHAHKAVRALLFEALGAVGRTDFARGSELAPMVATVRRALRMTRAHGEHEEREIHPFLQHLAPDLAATFAGAHARCNGLEHAIEQVLARLEQAPEVERVSLGRRLDGMLGALVAEHLRHLALEETRANRVLWAHLGDAELEVIHARIVAGIAAEELGEWLELMLLSGNRPERARLMAEVRAAVSAEAFVTLAARARARTGAALAAEDAVHVGVER